LRGEGVDANLNEAARYYKLAADQDYPEGHLNYGICLSLGDGVEPNMVEAGRYYKLTVDQNLAEGQLDYEPCLARGDDIDINLGEMTEIGHFFLGGEFLSRLC
jgi:TPR repeat protein